MNKLNKLFAILAIVVATMFVTMSVNAATNNDVISYISKAHTINGRTLQLNSTQIQQLTQYLTSNSVDNATADQIIANLDNAKNIISNTGATKLSDLNETVKADVMNKVKTAGSLAGLKVEFDTKNETVTIKDMNGNVVVSATSYAQLNSYTPPAAVDGSKKDEGASSNKKTTPSGKLVYTGSNNTVLIISGVAIVAIATAVIVKKHNA